MYKLLVLSESGWWLQPCKAAQTPVHHGTELDFFTDLHYGFE